MAARIGHAEKMLNTMVARAELSPAGKDWLIAAADPFHDRTLQNLCGYPDQQVGFSVTARVQQQFTLRKPSTIPAGTNWQAQICTYPWSIPNPDPIPPAPAVPLLDGYDLLGNVFTPTGAGAQLIWPVTAYTAADGDNIGPFEPSTSVDKMGVGIPSEYTRGPYRVVGWGYEITNTTADIYRQGTVTVYRQNTNAYEVESGNRCTPAVGVLTSTGAFDFYRLRRHPKNIAEASLLAGTRVWDAEKGAYIVCVMNKSTNPAKPVNFVQPVLMSEDSAAENILPAAPARSVYTHANTIGRATAPFGVTGPATTWGFVPYHMSGAMFTGLSDQTSLTVTVNWYIERFPSPDEASIVVLCKPSASYDPFALEFYDRMLCQMPVGVPVSENGLGEWFNGVVNSISRYVAPLARQFGGPIGNTVANIADSVHHVSGQMVAEDKARRKKKKAKAQRALPPPGPGVEARRRAPQTPPRKVLQNQPKQLARKR